MRLRGYKRLVLLTAILSIFPSVSFAIAQPAYTGRINSAVGGLITQKVGKWGFAANDPRYTATVGAVGSAATTVAVGVATGAVATVGWPALLIGAGVTAVAGGVISLGQDALEKWLWPDASNPGKVQLSGPGMSSVPVYSNGINSGTYAWSVDFGYWGSPQEALSYVFSRSISQYPQATFYNVTWVQDSPNQYTATYRWKNPQIGFPSESVATKTVVRLLYTGITCAGGTGYVSGTSCTPAGLYQAGNGLAGSVYVPSWKSPADAAADLKDSQGDKELSDELLAQLINTLWKRAGVVTPGTVPWSPSDPVTPADVADWKAKNPGVKPTVRDFVGPVAAPGATDVPVPVSGSQPSPAQPTAGSGSKVDLGPDPNIPAPTLEQTPTAQSILQPIFSLMPDLKSFAVPAHAGTCPTGQFEVYSKVYKLDSHCSLIESNRSIIEAAFLVCWTLAAVFIVLRA